MPRPAVAATRAGLLIAAGLVVGLAAHAGGSQPDPLGAVADAAARPAPPDPVFDPFPIRRVFVTGDRLTAALGQAARGTLVRLPRDEFEAKVRAASAAASGPPPRLVEARYKATLSDAGLTGTAEWKVAAAGPGLLPLEPLRQAVSNPKAGGAPVVLFRGEGIGRAGVFARIDRAGDSAVSLDWSARGAEEPAAERFDLAFPPAAVASLDLDLPADRVPAVASADQLLTGPFPGPAADRRVWRVAFGGQVRVDLTVRRPGHPDEPPAVVRANRTARYDLTPGQAACTFEFDPEALRGPVAEFVFEADPGLRVVDVTGPGRPAWRVQPGAPGAPTRVRVTAADPAAAGRIVVTAFALLPASPGEWSCPAVRLVGGLPGEDRIELRIDPELKFLGLAPGDYRVTTAAADRGYRVSLTGSLLPAGDARADRRPPSVRVRPAAVEVASTEDVTWTLARDRTELAATFKLRVLRGPLTRLTVRVPAGYAVAGVTATPDDGGLTTAVRGNVLTVEPSRPVAGGQTVELRVAFRGPPAVAPADPAAPSRPVAVPFPAFGPTVAERDGTFRVEMPAGFEAWPTPAPTTRTDDGLAYTYRGRPPDGVLTLTPHPGRVTASSDTTVSLDGGLTAATTVRVRAGGGDLGSVTLFAPLPPGVRWDVRADGATAARMPGGELVPWAAALAGSPWAAAAAFPGELWRVTFPRPVAGEATVVAVATGPSADAGVPIPTVLGAAHDKPHVTLAPAAAELYEAADPAGFPTVIRLRPRGERPPARRGWSFAGVEFVTRVEPDGRLSCTLAGRVTEAGGPVLPVALPGSAEAASATVAGRLVDLPTAGTQLALPLPPAGSDGVWFEVRYRLPAPHSEAVVPLPVRYVSPAPVLPGEAAASTRWAVSPEYRLWPTFDAPATPVAGGTEATVVRTAVLAGVGYAAAAVVLGLAVALAGGTVGRPRVVAFAAAVALLGAAGWLAPDGASPLVRPPLIAGVVGLAVLALRAGRPVPRPTPAVPSSARARLPSTASLGPAAMLLLVVAGGTVAQAPEPATVFVAAGPADRLVVLAPPAVLDRLDALARPAAPAVVIAAAEYVGEAAGDGSAAFTATFRVVCMRDGDHTLALPLGGVRLEQMDLDGKPAFPDGSAADRYTLAVRGAGRHEVVARFAVPLVVGGADREARFAAPDVPDCRVRFTAPAGARQPDVPTRHGAQTVGKAGDRPTVDADHGGGRAVAVRWREGAAGGANPTVTAEEACIWELTEAGESAAVAVVFRVEGGSTARVAVEVPDGFEPGRPVVRAADGRPGGPGLRDWSLAPGPAGWRTLSVGLQAPVEGRFAVVFRMTSVRPASTRPVLRSPRAAGVVRADGFAAVRASGVAVADLPRGGVIDFPTVELVRRFDTVPELGLDRAPDRAFQRVAGQVAELRPVVRPAGEAATGSAEVTWTLGPRAAAEGTVTVSRPGGAAAVEFDLPPAVRVDEVRGPDVFAWGRTGARVQVWMRKPARAATVRWAGGPRENLTDGAAVELPVPKVVAETVNPVAVKVRTAGGWAVAPASGGGDAFTADPSAPPPRVTAFAPAPLAAALREVVEPGGRYRATVTLAASGRPRSVTLGLTDGDDAELRGPDGVRVGPAVRVGDGVTWNVAVPAGGPREFVLTATVPVPGPLPDPVLTAGGPPLVWADRAPVASSGVVVRRTVAGWEVTLLLAPALQAAASSPAFQPKVAPPAADVGDETDPAARWLALGAWLAGLALVAGLPGGRWRPERLAGCGLLGATAAGVDTPAGVAFLTVAAVGIAVRGWRAARVLMR